MNMVLAKDEKPLEFSEEDNAITTDMGKKHHARHHHKHKKQSGKHHSSSNDHSKNHRFAQKNQFIGRFLGTDVKDERCCLCQYVVQRTMADIQLAGGLDPYFGKPKLENIPLPPPEPKDPAETSFLETSVTFPNSKDPNRRPRMYPFDSGDQLKSLVRHAYRVMDITLEGICESHMPPRYYLMVCQKIYEKQIKVAYMLANRMTAVEVCMGIEVCTRISYTSKSKHNPFDVKGLTDLKRAGISTKMDGKTFGYKGIPGIN